VSDRSDRITFSAGKKFDIQLSEALVNERRLGELFTAARLRKIELKSESWLWERTGNICIEYSDGGRPSGIAVCDADYWVHELKRDGATLVYLMFPAERLKELARAAYKAGRTKRGGDDGRMEMVLIRLKDILS
jgi:hypothetical protein